MRLIKIVFILYFVIILSQNCIASNTEFEQHVTNCAKKFVTHIQFVLLQQGFDESSPDSSNQQYNTLTPEQIKEIQRPIEETKSFFGLEEKLTPKEYRVENLPTLDEALEISSDQLADRKLLDKRTQLNLPIVHPDTIHLETAYRIKKAISFYLRDLLKPVNEYYITQIDNGSLERNPNSFVAYLTLTTRIAREFDFKNCVHFSFPNYKKLWIQAYKDYLALKELFRYALAAALINSDIDKSHLLNLVFYHSLNNNNSNKFKNDLINNKLTKDEFIHIENKLKIDLFNNLYKKIIYQVCCIKILQGNGVLRENETIQKHQEKIEENVDALYHVIYAIDKAVKIQQENLELKENEEDEKVKQRRLELQKFKDTMNKKRFSKAGAQDISSQTSAKKQERSDKRTSLKDLMKSFEKNSSSSSKPQIKFEEVTTKTKKKKKKKAQNISKFIESIIPEYSSIVPNDNDLESQPKVSDNVLIEQNSNEQEVISLDQEDRGLDNSISSGQEALLETLGQTKITDSSDKQKASEAVSVKDIKKKKKKKKKNSGNNKSYLVSECLDNKIKKKSNKNNGNIDKATLGQEASLETLGQTKITDSSDKQEASEAVSVKDIKKKKKKKNSGNNKSYVYGSVSILKKEESTKTSSSSHEKDQTSEVITNKNNSTNLESNNTENARAINGAQFLENLADYRIEELKEEQFFRKSFQNYENLDTEQLYKLLGEFYYSKVLINNPCLCSTTVQNVLRLIDRRKISLRNTPEYLSEIYSPDMDFVFCLRIQSNLSNANDQISFNEYLINYLDVAERNINSRLNDKISIQSQKIIYELSVLNGWQYNYSNINFVKKIF